MAPKDEDLTVDPPASVDPYEVLGIDKTATADQVKSAYRKAALKHHPGTPHSHLSYHYMHPSGSVTKSLCRQGQR